MKNLFWFLFELREKVPDPGNTKENYQSLMWKRNIKLEIYPKKKKNTKQPATYENRKIFDMKLVITEHPKLYMNYPRL